MDETGGNTVNVTDIKTSHEINLFEFLATYQNIWFIFYYVSLFYSLNKQNLK